MFVPVGWIFAECATKGALIYGVRKSFLEDFPASLEAYAGVHALYESSGRSGTNMQKVLEAAKAIGAKA
jgi:hypothetical protein